MPDLRKRIQVTLSEETFEAIEIVAELSGVSKARYLSDLIESGPGPSIREIARAFDAFNFVREDRTEDMQLAMQKAEEAVQKAVKVLLQSSGVEGRSTARAATEGRSSPPVLTGGLATRPRDQ